MMGPFESANIRCLFQLGTPLRPYAVVEESVSGKFAVLRITPEIYTFFLNADVPVCQPVTLSSEELSRLTPVCLFKIFIGAREPATFALVVDLESGDVTIVTIPSSVVCFYESLGIPECPVIDLSGNDGEDC